MDLFTSIENVCGTGPKEVSRTQHRRTQALLITSSDCTMYVDAVNVGNHDRKGR